MPDTYVVPSRFHIDKRAADLAEEIAADDVELDELLDTKELAMLTTSWHDLCLW